MSDKLSFFAELKRRNVYKVAVAYAVVGWLVIQVTATIVPALHLPDRLTTVVVVLVFVGFLIALVIAWAFESTSHGIDRTMVADALQRHSRGRTWIYVTAIGAIASIGLFLLGRYSARRAQSAADELRGDRDYAAILPQKSIAILPFENLSDDKSNAYFADGIQEEILTRLSKIADLKVISRTSTQKFKSAPPDLKEIAKQLGVGNILEGSVQKASDQVRISVQLINTLNDSHLWAETYDRKLSDVFQLETDLAQKIAASLEAKLTGREKKEIARQGTTNSQAYDAYLRALALQDRQSAQDLEQLINFARRAVELDSNYTQAWFLLALGESQKYFYPEQTEAQMERARIATETTNRLAPDSPEAAAALGLFNYYCLKNYDTAIAQLQIAHERAPNDANGLLSIGLVKRRQGKIEDSISVQQEAVRLDPLNEDIWANLGRGFRGLRRFEEARNAFERAHAIAPNDFEVPAQIAETYAAEGDIQTAWKIMEPLNPSPPDRAFGLKINVLVLQRRFDDVAKMMSSLLNNKNLPPLFIAIGHSGLAQVHIAKKDRAGAKPLLVKAEKELNQLRASGNNSILLQDVLMGVEANLGHRDEVQQIADSLLEATRSDAWQFPREEEAVARASVVLRDFDRAIPLIKHALSVPAVESLTTAYLRLDPSWDPIRNDPRFQKLIARSDM